MDVHEYGLATAVDPLSYYQSELVGAVQLCVDTANQPKCIPLTAIIFD